MLEEENKCWICLCSGDERPPLGTLKEAHDWVHPCNCSLVAHRKCLLEWVARNTLESKNEVINGFNSQELNIGLEALNVSDAYSSLHTGATGFQPLSLLGIAPFSAIPLDAATPFDPAEVSRVFSAEAEESVIQNVTTAMAAGAQERPLGSFPLGNSRKLVINTVCPQCNAPILLRTSRAPTVSMSAMVSKLLNWFAKTVTQTTVAGTIGGSILFSCGGLLTSWGLRIMTTLAPESTLLKLLDLPNASTLYQAFNKNQMGFKQFFLLGITPIYLLSFRFNHPFLTWPKRLYPILFLRPGENLNLNAKGFLLLQYPLLILSDFLKVFVYNHIYFEWVHSVKPYFICDQMSIKQFKIYEAEQQFIDMRREIREANGTSESLLSKLMKPFRSFIEEPVMRGICGRRMLMCARFDYSHALIKTSLWEKVASTLLFPTAGKLFHTIFLARLSWFKSFVAHKSSTPDDGLFLGNLLGCCAVVLLKDVMHLFVTWRRVKQLQSMEVMEYMSSEWEYTLNKKAGRILNQLSMLTENEESYLLLEEYSSKMLTRSYHDQWENVANGIPTITAKLNFFRYLVMKMSIERSTTYRNSKLKNNP
ncbi:LANO_0E02850g1_1 [Lachancea nothofagi CBS 11611]|uniref:LANO_0E02850g1_1 n=1 Tax=Lachancea nothofagi CBS 11611 TaxID=1266666 RepID=A0A1G4JQI2_9SACH|nr:LANO_0E02850g1_1 [Lachancea nothofagi CBS 11611]